MAANDTSDETPQQTAGTGRTLRALAVRGLVLTAALQLVPVAAAHEGSVHAGVPHRILLAGIILGGGILVGSLYQARRSWADRPRRTLTGVFVGLGFATLNTIGLIEIQVEPTTATLLFREWYPVIAFVAGTSLMLGSLVLGLRRWPHQPVYTVLGVFLGLWVGYPVLIPGIAIQHPLGYVLAASLPLALGYVLWRDVIPAVTSTDTLARRAGLVAGSIFAVFFLFSSGLLSFNPDQGVNGPTEAFVTVQWFANPLVLWPAVEFYVPSVPVFGAMSVGTALALFMLGGLVSTNAVLATTVWQRDIPMSASNGVFGAVATTGATACCCCGPALYGLASAVFGLAASPVYWALIDPSSPLGMLFFVGAVALLTGSNLQLARTLDDAGMCTLPA